MGHLSRSAAIITHIFVCIRYYHYCEWSCKFSSQSLLLWSFPQKKFLRNWKVFLNCGSSWNWSIFNFAMGIFTSKLPNQHFHRHVFLNLSIRFLISYHGCLLWLIISLVEYFILKDTIFPHIFIHSSKCHFFNSQKLSLPYFWTIRAKINNRLIKKFENTWGWIWVIEGL